MRHLIVDESGATVERWWSLISSAIAELVLPPDPRAVREARRFTERRCRHLELHEDLTDTVVHGRSDVRVPLARSRDEEASSGRGVNLVEEVASRWGVEKAVTGRVVWFTLLG